MVVRREQRQLSVVSHAGNDERKGYGNLLARGGVDGPAVPWVMPVAAAASGRLSLIEASEVGAANVFMVPSNSLASRSRVQSAR